MDLFQLLGGESHWRLVGLVPESVAELEVSELKSNNALDRWSDHIAGLLDLGNHSCEQVNIIDELVEASVDLDGLGVHDLSHVLPAVHRRQATELSDLGVRGQTVIATTLDVDGNQVQVEWRASGGVLGLEQVLGQVIADVLVDLHDRVLEETANN